MIDHFDLDDHFETIYGREPTVERYQRRKPDPHYIERALDDLGTRLALYVGDSPDDVVAAHRAGLDSVVVRREHRNSLGSIDEPTYKIERLTALTNIL
ncbi:HAD-IA family hydrolase [Haladaptatus sp. DYF46]|uniref:HAD family hydrolase n=1 Tax=Haladaptatus sp. DYF46 TaxID=2886041 RepID=UPI00210462AD|nr:HAD-IA family hydrolase [Haladaptatus sp. DYF46]